MEMLFICDKSIFGVASENAEKDRTGGEKEKEMNHAPLPSILTVIHPKTIIVVENALKAFIVMSSAAKTNVLERSFSCLAFALLVEGKAKVRWDDFRPRPTSNPLLSNREHRLREQCGTFFTPLQEPILNSQSNLEVVIPPLAFLRLKLEHISHVVS
jgi:hypothetical protein